MTRIGVSRLAGRVLVARQGARTALVHKQVLEAMRVITQASARSAERKLGATLAHGQLRAPRRGASSGLMPRVDVQSDP